MGSDFEIDAYRKDRELYVILRGRLVLSCCQDAKTRLGSLLTTQVDQFYLSMQELSFLDSAGLGVMVGLKMGANKNRTRLVLLSPPQRIQDIFRVSKLDTIFEIRSGAEADLIAANLKKPELCLWHDGKDAKQGQCNTVVDFGPKNGGTTQVSMSGIPNSETEAKVRQCCEEAVEFIKKGDYDRAIESYRRALGLDQDNLSALNNLGIVYEKRPDWYTQAIDTWKRVLDLSERAGDEKHASRARKHLDTLGKLTRSN